MFDKPEHVCGLQKHTFTPKSWNIYGSYSSGYSDNRVLRALTSYMFESTVVDIEMSYDSRAGLGRYATVHMFKHSAASLKIASAQLYGESFHVSLELFIQSHPIRSKSGVSYSIYSNQEVFKVPQWRERLSRTMCVFKRGEYVAYARVGSLFSSSDIYSSHYNLDHKDKPTWMKNMASIMEPRSKSQSVYRTLEERDTSWLLWPLIILLMNVLGGPAALFNSDSALLWLACTMPRKVQRWLARRWRRVTSLGIKMQSVIHQGWKKKKLHMHNVVRLGVFICDNVEQTVSLAGCSSWFQQGIMLMMQTSHF